MKTKITLAIISLLLNTVLLAGGNTNYTTEKDSLALNTFSMSLPEVEEETYINDIPFDTKLIAIKSLFVNLPKPDAESYVDDIPFNTAEIAASANYFANTIEPEDEEYIDDIPFNTADIVEDYIINGHGIAAKPTLTGCHE